MSNNVINNPYRAIASGLVKDDGSLKTFEEQLSDYAYQIMPAGDAFIVSKSVYEAGITEAEDLSEAEDLPVVMTQKTLRKVNIDHDIPLHEIARVPEWLRLHPLALESLQDINTLVIVTDAKDFAGNDIIVALHLKKECRQFSINEIASVYGKKNLSYLVENTFAASKKIYVNERTDDWLRRAGLPLPERVANYLSDLIIAHNKENTIGLSKNPLNEPESKPVMSDELYMVNEQLQEKMALVFDWQKETGSDLGIRMDPYGNMFAIDLRRSRRQGESVPAFDDPDKYEHEVNFRYGYVAQLQSENWKNRGIIAPNAKEQNEEPGDVKAPKHQKKERLFGPGGRVERARAKADELNKPAREQGVKGKSRDETML